MSLISIQLQIDPQVADLIDRKCGGPSHGGKRGGRAHYLRQLVYKDVGIPTDPGWLGRGPSDDLEIIDERILAQEDRTCAEVIRLIKQGLSYRDVARHMRDERVPTPRGGKWTYQTVRNYVRKAVDFFTK